MVKNKTQLSQNSAISLSFQSIFDSLSSFLPYLIRSPLRVMNFTLMCFNQLTQIGLFVVLIGQTVHVLHSNQKRFINIRHLLIKWIIYVILIRLVEQIKHHTIFDQLFILLCNAFAFVLVFPSKFIKNLHLKYFSYSEKKQYDEGMDDPAMMDLTLTTKILISLSIFFLDLSRLLITFVPLNQRRKIQESLKEVNLTIVEQKYFGKIYDTKARRSGQLSQLAQSQGVAPGIQNLEKSYRSSKAVKPQKSKPDNSIKMKVQQHIEINLGSIISSERGTRKLTFYRNLQISYNVQTTELSITNQDDKRTITQILSQIVIIDDLMLQFIFQGEESYPMFVKFKSKKEKQLFINYIYLESS